MSFQRFTYHQYPPSRRTQRGHASDKKRYNAWCRRRAPFYIKVQKIPIPLTAPPKKCIISTYYLPPQRKPTYMNDSLVYLRSHTTRGKEAYEWVNQGCLIGLREI